MFFMKNKGKINSIRAVLLLKVSNEIIKLRSNEKMLINSVSLSTINSQYNYNNFEMNFENPIEIGKLITGISKSTFKKEDKKLKQNKRENTKKYSYKRPKFLYRLALNSSNILNIINQINDVDLSKIRKRKIISEAKFKELETPSTINNLFPYGTEKEHAFNEKQGLNYLRELAKTFKDITKCRINRKSMKSSKTMRLSLTERNQINEQLLKTKKKIETPPKLKAKSDKNIVGVFKPSKFKTNSDKLNFNTNFNVNVNVNIINHFNLNTDRRDYHVIDFENNINNINDLQNTNKSNNINEKEENYPIKKQMSKKKSITFVLPEEIKKGEDNGI